MLSSAAEEAVHLIAQSGQLVQRDRQAYAAIRNSVATIVDGEKSRNLAALIDRSGVFLTFTVGTPPASIELRLNSGKRVTATFVGRDASTQLAAYATSDDVRTLVPTHVAIDAPSPGAQVLAVSPDGGGRGVIVRTDGFGVLNNSRRMLPLYELRFEGSAELVGGAFVFNSRGELVSVISAALIPAETNNLSVQNLSTSLVGRNGQSLQAQVSPFGPGGMAVTYVPSVASIRRAVDGFLSPSHRVLHPALGLFCVNDPMGGAQVQQVVKGSAAEKAGLQVGDVLVAMNMIQIRNQLDFAHFMFEQKPGAKVSIVFVRGNSRRGTSAIVGAMAD